MHKRWKFGKRSEQLSPVQTSLLDEAIDADPVPIEAELDVPVPSPRSLPFDGPDLRLAHSRPQPAIPSKTIRCNKYDTIENFQKSQVNSMCLRNPLQHLFSSYMRGCCQLVKRRLTGC
ncbi:transposase [Ralstonia pseudosolanacearum]|nr:transposase [Ralstonia pseudosolanacearum]